MKMKKNLAMLGLGIIASSNVLASSFYQCMPCPTGSYSINGRCRYIKDLVENDFNRIANASPGSSSCPTGTLQPGWYLVKLRGGKAGGWNSAIGIMYEQNEARLQYIFYLDKTSSYMLCAGGNGGWDNRLSRGGGGGGSWLKLNFGGKDYYFVAGGGSGFGGGGGIGGGGSAGSEGSDGGRSGPYAGGTYTGDQFGKGLNNGRTYAGIASGGGGGATGLNYLASSSAVGFCPLLTINIINEYKTTGMAIGGFGGSTSHVSNTTISACGSSCAMLYKLK